MDWFLRSPRCRHGLVMTVRETEGTDDTSHAQPRSSIDRDTMASDLI